MFDLTSTALEILCNRRFHHGTRAKAEKLFRDGMVLQFDVNNIGSQCEITAKVQGSAPLPYRVAVSLRRQGFGVSMDTHCSCPMLEDCKHAYATILAARARQPVPAPMPSAARPPGGAARRTQPAPASSRFTAEWKSWLERVSNADPVKTADPGSAGGSPEQTRRLLYLLKPSKGRRGVLLEFFDTCFLPNGTVKTKDSVSLSELLFRTDPGLLQDADLVLLRRVFLSMDSDRFAAVELRGRPGAEVLGEILSTGRCCWRALTKSSGAIALGESRPGRPVWRMDNRGWQEPGLEVTPPAIILPLSPPWYLDEEQGRCGPLETGLPPETAGEWLSGPTLSPEQSEMFWREIPEGALATLPQPVKITVETAPVAPPTFCLTLTSIDRPEEFTFFDEDESEQCHLARLEFDYAGHRVSEQDRQEVLEQYRDGRLRRIPRDLRAEQLSRRQLEKMGFVPAEEIYSLRGREHSGELTIVEDSDWYAFVMQDLPSLVAKGWHVEMEPDFAFRIAQPEAWYADAQPASGVDWFDAEVGVQLDGQKVNLLPILLEHFSQFPDLFGPGILSQLDDSRHFLVPLPDGRRLPFPVPRLKLMLGVLMDLFEPKALDQHGRLRLNKLRAAELSGTAGTASFRWLGGENLRALNDKLRDFRSIRLVPPPEGLQTTLRGYQQEGLNWLQFLREYNLAGILADDMGLGKTVQALAHLLEEKKQGRGGDPSLIVAPTSLMTNWRQETERFAPALKLLVLHGQDRKQHFEKLRDYDLIITSYALLPRDEAVLLKQQFHLVILDEAQYIKNPKTECARVVCQLPARHHLCLTGTPMENHLGELWSQFNFLLPGFLGDETRFRKVFRNPIEKGGDAGRRDVLARRIGPFVLRRRKEEVASELPPKTEIRHNVELSGGQRDLYETIRLAMHARVQAEVQKKGMSRAHIVILDALLKLRQVCCDPRLVKLDAARSVTDSSKLELLMDLVPEMLAEGRKILLFSQFTSMLALIQEELAKASIPYVILTGQTTDRATPIQEFQSGKAPLFLISLKAGGIGLNLTAADTVIHYDPWWNPAVEAQATDRAHRIGQSKSVFVYKLITVGTVEERIVALQERKRGLVEALLDENRKEMPQLTPEDLQVLFAPLG